MLADSTKPQKTKNIEEMRDLARWSPRFTEETFLPY